MEALEQRVSKLYQYIGDPQGELFASAKQVQRLETIIQEQQQIIYQLQSRQNFFQKDAAAYFEDQLERIVKQKGIRNTDFISLTQLFTQNLTHAVTTLQTEFTAALKNSLQTEKIQELESQIKRLKNSPTSPSGNSELTGKLQELETRLALLEIQSPTLPTGNTVPGKQSVSDTDLDVIKQEIEVLKDHVKHLEDNLITEVQKHYKMSAKQGELAAPLTRIQNTVQMLDKEFQSFRGVDVRKVAEAMIGTATENLRTEFQTALATRASMEQLTKFDADIRRIEAYSTDVQTGFYKMRNHLEDVAAKMTDSFSETRWGKLENSLKKSLEMKHTEQHATWKLLLETQDTEIQRTVQSIQRAAEKVFEDVKTNTSPEAFEVQLRRLQNALTESQEGWLEKIAEPLQVRMTTVEQQSQQTRSGFLELISDMKTELAASNLKSKYDEFETRLAGFTKITEDWNKRLQKSEEAHKQILAFSEARIEQTVKAMTALETENSRIRVAVAEMQQQTKRELDTWLRDRNGDIQKRFTDAAQEIQHIQRNTVALESELYKQLEIYRNQERVWADKYREFQTAAETTVVAWREEQSTYIISRIAELSSTVRKQIQESNERAAVIETIIEASDMIEINNMRLRVSDCLERITELNRQFNQNTIQVLQKNIETNVRTVLFEWLRKRIEEETTLLPKKKTMHAIQKTNQEQLNYQSHTKCFYTALFGIPGTEMDTLAQIQPIPGWDYICFTNITIQEPNGWTIIHVPLDGKSPQKLAKHYKWQSHKYLEDYDIVVWVDAYISPASFAGDKLYQWITLMNERGLSVLHRKHDMRDCIWDECEAVLTAKRDTPEHVQKIREILTAEKMPRHIGLFDTNIILKFHKRPAVKKVANEIAYYLEEYTRRDQLVVTYVYYKNNFNEFSTTNLLHAFEKMGHHVRKDMF